MAVLRCRIFSRASSPICASASALLVHTAVSMLAIHGIRNRDDALTVMLRIFMIPSGALHPGHLMISGLMVEVPSRGLRGKVPGPRCATSPRLIPRGCRSGGYSMMNWIAIGYSSTELEAQPIAAQTASPAISSSDHTWSATPASMEIRQRRRRRVQDRAPQREARPVVRHPAMVHELGDRAGAPGAGGHGAGRRNS